MKVSENAINLIKKFEGLRLESYKCSANKWTIGYGHTKTAGPNMIIDKITADLLLRDDIKYFENIINKLVKVKLNQNQFDALVSLVFNIGEGNFGKSSLLKYLNQGNFELAANEFDKYNKAKGKVIPGLIKRRAEEKKLFLTK